MFIQRRVQQVDGLAVRWLTTHRVLVQQSTEGVLPTQTWQSKSKYVMKDHSHPDTNSFAHIPSSGPLLPNMRREEAICLKEKSLKEGSVRWCQAKQLTHVCEFLLHLRPCSSSATCFPNLSVMAWGQRVGKKYQACWRQVLGHDHGTEPWRKA